MHRQSEGLSAPQCEGWLFPNGGAKVQVIWEGVKKPIVGWIRGNKKSR